MSNPTISSFSPLRASPGDSIVISGSFLSLVERVEFNGRSASFTVNSATQITAIVPYSARSGPISAISRNSIVNSNEYFTLIGNAESLPSGENFIGAVGGRTVSVILSFTRPADTIAYAAGDAVSNSTSAPTTFIFTNAARVPAGSGIIVAAKLTKNNTITTNASFRLWIYEAAPSSIPADNAPFTIAWANRINRRGYIDFSSPILGSDCCEYYSSPNQQMTFKLPTGTSLFFVLQALAPYVPASSEQFSVELSILQD